MGYIDSLFPSLDSSDIALLLFAAYVLMGVMLLLVTRSHLHLSGMKSYWQIVQYERQRWGANSDDAAAWALTVHLLWLMLSPLAFVIAFAIHHWRRHRLRKAAWQQQVAVESDLADALERRRLPNDDGARQWR